MRVTFCTPTITRPHDAYLEALRASLPLLEAAGIEHKAVFEVGNPYISAARAELLRKAEIAGTDVYLFIDHDLSWRPEDLLTLIQTPGDVVAGTYRFKAEPEDYMGAIFTDEDGIPITREDGCIAAKHAPAGFLKVTQAGVDGFKAAYPALCYGEGAVDLFNHGAHDGVWYGEDYAFCRNWRDDGGAIWLVPDLDLTHHSATEAYPGNYYHYLLRQPGGSEAPKE